MSEMKVDILIPYSGQGGVEMVVNQTALFLKARAARSALYDGLGWYPVACASIDFYPLRRERVQDMSSLRICMSVSESNGMPDAVLLRRGHFLPMLQEGLKVLGREADCRIISWLHAPVEI